MRICIQEPLLISKIFIVLLHTLSAYNSLLVRCKVYSCVPRECLCVSWTYAEAYETFSIEPASCQKNPIKKQNCHIKLSAFTTRRSLHWNKLKLNNCKSWVIHHDWTGHHLSWFRFLKLLLIFYCQSSWQEISILKKQFLIRPGVS